VGGQAGHFAAATWCACDHPARQYPEQLPLDLQIDANPAHLQTTRGEVGQYLDSKCLI